MTSKSHLLDLETTELEITAEAHPPVLRETQKWIYVTILMLINTIISVSCGFSFSQVNDPNHTVSKGNKTHSQEPAHDSISHSSSVQFTIFFLLVLACLIELLLWLLPTLFLTSGNLGLSSGIQITTYLRIIEQS